MGNELSYEYGYYDTGGGDGGVNRRNWNDVSQASVRREKQAEAAFATLKKDWESRQDLTAGWRHVIPLLDPSHHLVEKVWIRFRKHVKASSSSSSTSGGGGGSRGHWDLRRRVANQEERKSFCITRKSKAYFVDAIFTVYGGDVSNNKKNNQAGGGGSQEATLAVATVDAPAAAALLENKKRTASRHLPGLLLPNTSTSGGAIIAAGNHLSKKPRRLQDLSINTTGNPNNTNPTQKKPAPVVSISTLPLGVHHHHHLFKYGDIVAIVNPSSSSASSPRNVIAASHPAAAVQYRPPPPPTLAMVVCLVDPHTVRIVYPNQVHAHVPILQIQLVKPMPVMPMIPVPVVVVGGNNSNNNNVASKTEK